LVLFEWGFGSDLHNREQFKEVIFLKIQAVKRLNKQEDLRFQRDGGKIKSKDKKIKMGSCNGKYYLPVSLNTVSIQKEKIK
jgi:hypothetical protein